MKRVLVIIGVSCSLWVSSAMADEGSHRALAEELVSIMNVQKSIERVFERVKQTQVAQLRKLQVSEEESEIVERGAAKLTEIIEKELNWGKVRVKYISIYQETFTEGELRGIVEFYRTPLGRKFVDKTPELMRQSMEINETQMSRLAPKIRAVTLGVVQEISESKTNSKERKE